MNVIRGLHRKISPALVTTMRSAFVNKARSLEALKNAEIPQETFINAKYLVTVDGTDYVLMDSTERKIAWTDGIVLQNELLSSCKVLLRVINEEPLTCLFAIALSLGVGVEELGRKLGGKFHHLRRALFLVNDEDSCLLSQAQGLLNFCQTTKYCKTCGNELETRSSGTFKFCNSCNRAHYPTLSPVGIVLIENKTHDQVLLARGARHPPGMYSCIAGFIEPGESIEENIRREVAEEVGLDLDKIDYVASQHWAMSDSQLMIGCIATAASDDFLIDPNELQSAQWVSADRLTVALNEAKNLNRSLGALDNTQSIWVPPPAAVAHTLMESWLKKFHGYAPTVTSRI